MAKTGGQNRKANPMLVTLIVDASWCHMTKAGGFGFWIASERYKGPGGGRFRTLVESATEAEAAGIVNATSLCLQRGQISEKDTLLVQCDCTGALDTLQGKAGKSSGLGRIREVWERIVNEYKLTVRYRHVKGHTNHAAGRFAANRHCDTRAKEHMRAMRKELQNDK